MHTVKQIKNLMTMNDKKTKRLENEIKKLEKLRITLLEQLELKNQAEANAKTKRKSA